MSNIHDHSQPRPPRKHPVIRKMAIISAVFAGLIVVIFIIAALTSGPSVTKSSSQPSAPPQSASASETATPSATPAQDNFSGPGVAFTVTTQDQNGNDVKYDITARKILDPARGADEFNTPDSGKRFVGVEFTVTGEAGYSNDDANNDAIVIGSNGQTYTADFSSISAGTNFNNGEFSVTAGKSESGWVVFQVPKGVKVHSVQWQPGFGDQQPATWTV